MLYNEVFNIATPHGLLSTLDNKKQLIKFKPLKLTLS